MAIKKSIEVDGHVVRGYVDIGAEITDDERDLATEALVIMVTAANGHWKIPVAYFLISTLTGIERAAILNESIKRIYETDANINIISVTCDSPQVHQTMIRCLGCKCR